MKKVMIRAWEIARAAVVKFGGSVKSFFSQSLKMAWAEIKKGVSEMLNKVINALNGLQEVKFNKIYAEKAIADATEMFNNGWDALEDETVLLTKGNLVAVKQGNKMVKYEMNDFRITAGKLIGNIDKITEEREVEDRLKEAYLAQAIITKYYTINRA